MTQLQFGYMVCVHYELRAKFALEELTQSPFVEKPLTHCEGEVVAFVKFVQ